MSATFDFLILLFMTMMMMVMMMVIMSFACSSIYSSFLVVEWCFVYGSDLDRIISFIMENAQDHVCVRERTHLYRNVLCLVSLIMMARNVKGVMGKLDEKGSGRIGPLHAQMIGIERG